MGKCIVCGQKGLFLQVDDKGMCPNCAAKYRETLELKNQQELQDAKAFYWQIVADYKEISADIIVDTATEKLPHNINLVRQKISLCDKLIKYIPSYSQYVKLPLVLLETLTFSDSPGSIRKLGYNHDLEISVWTDRADFVDHAIEDVIKNIRRKESLLYKAISRLKTDTAFAVTLESLEQCDIALSHESVPQGKIADLNGLTYSSVTSKSNPSKLGTFVVVDVETTGLKCVQDEIIEVSAIIFEDWVPSRCFSSLIKPKKSIPPRITSINRISNQMVVNSPSIEQVIPALTDFIGNYNMVGHNLPFDLNFLYRNGLNILAKKRKYFDTLELAKKVVKGPTKRWNSDTAGYVTDFNIDYEVENHKLETLCDYFEIRDNSSAHRALSDCLATGYLFQSLVSLRTACENQRSYLTASPKPIPYSGELLYTKWGVYKKPVPYIIRVERDYYPSHGDRLE